MTDAYTILSNYMRDSTVDGSQSEISAINRDQAVDVLCRSDKLDLEPGDAEHALTRLLERGYFYEVDNELRVTVPPGER